MDYIENGPAKSESRLVLAHGAGAAMDSPFMDFFAEKVGDAGIHVVRFEFAYMQQRRTTGSKRPPDRQPKLLDCWRQVIKDFGPARKLFIGGKSMGGRMASLMADEEQVRGLVCLGYPFYAIGKKDKPRTEHLATLKTPTLIVQGVRDTMGDVNSVAEYSLSPEITIDWIADGDHSFKPRKSSGRTEAQNWIQACESVVRFIHSQS
ncbi:MAG: dienelactone hydrolase family protein [Sneathiella sp.]|nr:dienelactone hydrolase family protein [Sneathiella sp.]